MKKKYYRICGKVIVADSVFPVEELVDPSECFIEADCKLEAVWAFCKMIATREGLRHDQVIIDKNKLMRIEETAI